MKLRLLVFSIFLPYKFHKNHIYEYSYITIILKTTFVLSFTPFRMKIVYLDEKKQCAGRTSQLHQTAALIFLNTY